MFPSLRETNQKVNYTLSTTNCAFLFQTLVHSIPLYFSVKAQNSMGLSAVTSCELSTYDMTLPEGRITPDFRSTSHREVLQGSALALDDSVITTHQVTMTLKGSKSQRFGVGLTVLVKSNNFQKQSHFLCQRLSRKKRTHGRRKSMD